MSSPQPPSLAVQNRDSNAVRASVFDACLKLGALDENSLISQWMFSDPSTDTDDSLQTRNRTTRFQEALSTDWDGGAADEEDSRHRRRRIFPFSFIRRSSVFSNRRRNSARLSHEHDPENPNTNSSSSSEHDIGTGYVSLNRRSFFRRSIDKHAAQALRTEPATDTNAHGAPDRLSSSHKPFFIRRSLQKPTPDGAESSEGRVSINPKSFFQLKPSNTRATNTLDPLPEGDDDEGDDEEWEEIEARPRSPLYALHNKGINPPPLIPENKRHSKRHSVAAATATAAATQMIPQTETPTSVNTDDRREAAEVDIQGAKHHSFSFAIPRLMFRHGHGAVDDRGGHRRRSSPPSHLQAQDQSPPRSRSRSWSWSRISKGSPPGHGKENTSSLPASNSTPTSTATEAYPLPPPSPSRKPRKRRSKPSHLRVFTAHRQYHHRRTSRSDSLPASPFVLLTSDEASTMPQPTSRIVFSGEDSSLPLPPPPPEYTGGTFLAETGADQKNVRRAPSMGYHHQFFVNNEDNARGSDDSMQRELPSLPASPTSPALPSLPSSPVSPPSSPSSPTSPGSPGSGSTQRRRLKKRTKSTPTSPSSAPAPAPSSAAVVPIRSPPRRASSGNASRGQVLRKHHTAAAVPFPSSTTTRQ